MIKGLDKMIAKKRGDIVFYAGSYCTIKNVCDLEGIAYTAECSYKYKDNATGENKVQIITFMIPDLDKKYCTLIRRPESKDDNKKGNKWPR